VNEIQGDSSRGRLIRRLGAYPAAGHACRDRRSIRIARLDLYWKAHDFRPSSYRRGGIIYCLSQSIAEGSSSAADELRDVAKRLAYNVGSFTWPGWEEPGIDPTPRQALAATVRG